MKRIHQIAVGGLLWLAFCAVASATTIDLTYNFTAAGDGGGFSAYLNGNSSQTFEVFCVDYLNYSDESTAYPVNIDDAGVTVADTRYGTTPTANFSDQVDVDGSAASAQQRYVMAGWLTTQYILNPTDQAQIDQNSGVQYAIWTLLNTGNYAQFSTTDEATWLTNALNWATNAENNNTFNAFADTVDVYTAVTTSQTSIPDRYTTGYQEMIGVTPTPEPAAMALVGIGLLGLGLVRRRKLA
jgi:hypothetical protein